MNRIENFLSLDALVVGHGLQDSVESTNPQCLMSRNGDAMRRRFLGLHNDMASNLVDFDVTPISAQCGNKGVTTHIRW